MTSREHLFPRLRWLGPVWLAIYVPSYALAYGWANFLFLCNLGVVVTALALWRGSRAWLSAAALAALPIGLVWAVDFFTGIATGKLPFGFTAYMWEARHPLFTRALSLYHLAWPILLVTLLRKVGYDRRGWALQSALALLVLPLCRAVTAPEENVNFVFRAPFFDRQLGPAPLHLAIVGVATVVGLYGLTHGVLSATLGGGSAAVRSRAREGGALDLELARSNVGEGDA